MIKNWFECKVRYEKMQENGSTKKVTEPYLFDALSFTETEVRIIEEITPFISGEFTVSGIKKANYSELFFSDDASADRWYKCKVEFITLDEKLGNEKKTASSMLVQACSLQDALNSLKKGMEGSMCDYNVASVVETSLMDVYVYQSNENE